MGGKGRQTDSVFYAYKGVVGGRRGLRQTKKHTVSMEIPSFDSKTWWEVGLRDREGYLLGFILGGEMALCGQ